ncbi:peptidase M50B-like protein [Nocardioides albertanoniae]|uniref:Peptidase M50B-like protein n=1 Tax=Nocardioides albertanoniae TaxID=1175486 RepID=A0A543A3D7_9ACTN|nr:M50 family metallopeptidase [Nocardioides albertanoniae]TQL67097.1 peptidase M50B-like protein [Nocardioides albertanoniae]
MIDFWHTITATQAVPEAPWLIGAGLVALALVVWRTSWRTVRLGVTVVHEAGHAVVAVLVGRRLSGIKLHSDTSGVTLSRGKPSGPGMVAMLAAGYLAPALLGLLSATLLAAGHALGLLWLLVAAMLVLLLWVRNGYGLVVLLVLGAALGAISWYGDDRIQTVAATLVTWLLLLASPRPLLELLGRGARGRRGSDPDQLAGLTGIPSVMWILGLLVVNLAGLVVGVTTLVPTLSDLV